MLKQDNITKTVSALRFPTYHLVTINNGRCLNETPLNIRLLFMKGRNMSIVHGTLIHTLLVRRYVLSVLFHCALHSINMNSIRTRTAYTRTCCL